MHFSASRAAYVLRRVAIQWAQLYWLHACALLYAPLAPFFYGVASLYCLFSFACTKVGVVCWYKRPPAVNTRLGAVFRMLVLLLLPLHLLVKLCVRLAAEPLADAPYSVGYFAVGLLGLCAALPRMLTSSGTAYSYQEVEQLDTNGVRYDEVEKTQAYAIDVYVNPLRRVTKGVARKARTGFFGEPPPASRAAAVSENVDQNTAVLASSLPMDDLPVLG
jgi:hypothetical protein